MLCVLFESMDPAIVHAPLGAVDDFAIQLISAVLCCALAQASGPGSTHGRLQRSWIGVRVNIPRAEESMLH